MALPDYLIIGAMKCGTSTLAVQLGAQPGLFMTTPKEPNFFSDDAIYSRGATWYQALFDDAKPGDIKGEASTHYTKLPTHPDTLSRLRNLLEAPKIIYLIRNPVERAVSHYIHEWTMGVMTEDIGTAFDIHPELTAYSCYGRQIEPWVAAFGADSIHLASLEEIERQPQVVLDAVCGFLGYTGTPVWQREQARVNVSAERIRRFPLHGLLIDNPLAARLRRALVPQGLRDRIKRGRQIQDRPHLSPERIRALETVFAQDRAVLSSMFPGQGPLTTSYPFLGAP